MLSRFHLIPERYGQTDRFAISISHVSILTRDKNGIKHIFVDIMDSIQQKTLKHANDMLLLDYVDHLYHSSLA